MINNKVFISCYLHSQRLDKTKQPPKPKETPPETLLDSLSCAWKVAMIHFTLGKRNILFYILFFSIALYWQKSLSSFKIRDKQDATKTFLEVTQVAKF